MFGNDSVTRSGKLECKVLQKYSYCFISLMCFVDLETPGFVIVFQLIYNTVMCYMNIFNRIIGM